MIIDLPFGIGDLDAVFAVTDFLSNTEELLQDFHPEVSKFLVRRDFFSGPFLAEYNAQFDELIRSLIKRQLVQHYNFTPEELMVLTDVGFLKMIAPDLFNRSHYESKEGSLI